MAKQEETLYKIIFYNKDQVYEVFARQVYQSDLFGFLEIEEFVFGERSQVLVDPGEEKLKNEFASVKRSYIPLNAIVRIDEVEEEGGARISEVKHNPVAHFPRAPFPTHDPSGS